MEVFRGLSENPYFGAGFGLFGVGAAAAAGRKAGQAALALFKRHYVTTLEVPINDKSYHWVLDWLTRTGARRTQHLSVRTHYDEDAAAEAGRISTRFNLVPSVGTHVFKHERSGAWIKVERSREQQQVDFIGGTPWETVVLKTIGQRRQLFSEILEEARRDALAHIQGRTLTYICEGGEWVKFGAPKLKRPLESVTLAEGISESLVNDLESFLTRGDWYRRRGVPHRRGYLLYGPPGCGKTSLVSALAGHFDMSVCVLNLSEQTLTDERLARRMAETPENSLLLLEDIDVAFASRTTTVSKVTGLREKSFLRDDTKASNSVTLSGLLNALDGMTSGEGARVLFMTTNHVDRLDPALIRPGRVDRRHYVGCCTEDQAVKMFENFYPDSTEADARLFAKALDLGWRKSKLSPASLQSLFLKHKELKELTPEAIREFLNAEDKRTKSSS